MSATKKPRGRPAIAENDRLQVVPIRLHPDDMAALKSMAGDRGPTTLAREIIEKHVKRARKAK